MLLVGKEEAGCKPRGGSVAQSAVHTTQAELHGVLAVQPHVSQVKESRPQQVSLVSQYEHFLLPGWTQN